MEGKYLDQSAVDGWSDHPDFKGRAKSIGKYRVEFLGSPNAGAEIIIWEPGYEELEHVFPPSDDKKYHKADTIGFWYYSNAKVEYQALKTVKSVIDLMWRNM